MNDPAKARAAPIGFLAILVAVSSLNPLAINIFVPSLPGMMETFGTDFGTIQLTLSLYLFATAIAQLAIGPLSDRFGRRAVLLAGLGLFVLSSLLCAFAGSIGTLLFGRVLQGASGCAGIVTARAIVRDRYNREQAVAMLAYLTMGYASAPMIGPVIGGIVNDHLGWRANFVLIAAASAICTAWAWRSLPETRPSAAALERDAAFIKEVFQLVRLPAFWAYTLVAAFATCGFFAFLGGAPYVSSTLLGLSGTGFGIYFVFISLSYIAGNYLSARLAPRVGLHVMIVTGSTISLVAAAAMTILLVAGWLSSLTFFGPICVITFASGLVLPSGITGSVSVRPNLAGSASGVGGSLQMGFGAVASLVVGWLLSAYESAIPLALSIVCFGGASLVSGLWSRTARS
jgi:DHA1 family bicyclomycin/chloramphenicol resistance-like MFS transporter